jgi:hypothetical protein
VPKPDMSRCSKNPLSKARLFDHLSAIVRSCGHRREGHCVELLPVVASTTMEPTMWGCR